MKVCTDSCLFGAMIPAENTTAILDIGTGTGLLSLMLAQRSDAQITAIEIEDSAAWQAKENFENSPWKDRLKLHHTSIQAFARISQAKFDLIVTNPPFFSNNLKRSAKSQNIALHSDKLTFPELADSIAGLLSDEGTVWVMLPPHESEVFKEIMERKGFFLKELYKIYAREGEKLIRHICCYSLKKIPHQAFDMAIKNIDNEYSAHFSKLLQNYYLSPEEKDLIR